MDGSALNCGAPAGIVSQWSVTLLSGVPSYHKQQLRSAHWVGMQMLPHKKPLVMFSDVSERITFDRPGLSARTGVFTCTSVEEEPVKTRFWRTETSSAFNLPSLFVIMNKEKAGN